MSKNSNSKILLLRPASSASGGIKNYFEVLKNELDLPVDFFTRGARNWPYKPSKLNEFLRFLKDYYRFVKKIQKGNYKIVQTSTSLSSLSIIRDGLFLLLAKRFGLKTIVFYRGWDEGFSLTLQKRYLPIFKKIYFSTDCSIVLSESFKEKLILWGYEKPIFVETTIVDSSLFHGINFNIVNYRSDKYSKDGIKKFLFLARVEKEKGIYETLEAFRSVNVKFNNISLTISGDGKELNAVKSYVENQKIENVHFTGFIKSVDKQRVLLEADVYIFPSYTEGMPNSVLEAMAFGLPIISTPVGSLDDLIINGKSGYKVSVKNITELADSIINICREPVTAIKIAKYNYNLAQEQFLSEIVAKRIEKIYKKYI